MMQTGKNELELPPPRQTNPKVSSTAKLILVDPRTLIEQSMDTSEEFKPHGQGYLFDHLGMTFAFTPSGVANGLLTLERHHFSWKGRVHAGTLFALADSCAGFGCMRSLPEGATGFATLETKTNFVATTDGGVIKAVAKAMHLGQSTQIWDVEITSEKDQKTLAWFRCTQVIMWPRPAS